MANLKDLKNRISSVKSTQKITKAMQMVAASKLRKAQARAESARPYTEKMERMLVELAKGVNPENAPALLTGHLNQDGHRKTATCLLIVATADRGLCGGFNSSIVKESRKQLTQLQRQGKNPGIFTVGKKGREQLKVSHGTFIKYKFDTSDRKQPEFSDAEAIAEQAIKLFESGDIDVCRIIYSRFVSPLEQNVTVQQLIPLDLQSLTEKTEKIAGASASYEYEPDEETILSELLPRNIAVQIYRAQLENAASEQGARMTAMDNATRNAGEMIDDLTLMYNRTRQAAITTELTEIVAGAEAV